MNQKLKIKLARKAAKIKKIMVASVSAAAVGVLAFNEIGGSYGVTINPYEKGTPAFTDFRMGFMSARDKSKKVIRGAVNVNSRTRGAFGQTERLNKLRQAQQKPLQKMAEEAAAA